MPSRAWLLALALAPGLLAAQEPVTSAPVQIDAGPGWRWHRATTVILGRQMGFGLGGGMAFDRPAIPGPVPLGARLSFIGHYGITGSRDLTVGFEAPGWNRDWRLLALVRSERLLRTPYFGFANTDREQDSLKQTYSNKFYRSALLRTSAMATVQRRIAGPLWLHLAGQIRRYRTSALKQSPTLYSRDMTAAALPDTQRFNGGEGRVGLIWDTRDDWVLPSRGAKLEAVMAKGTLSGATLSGALRYQRFMIGAREFIALGTGQTILALRQRVSLSSDTLPFFLAYEQITSWTPEDGVVGSRSIRLHGGGSQLGSNSAMLSVDLRRIIIPPDWPERERRLWGLLFADLGTIWEPRQAEPFSRKEWTLGTGFRIQFNRSFVLGVDGGITNAGPSASAGSHFAF